MKLIVGLGNPGLRYARTRHNQGFRLIDELSKRWRIGLTRHKFQAVYGAGVVHGQSVVLVKPQTFMNRSGQAVANLVAFFRLESADLLICYDDLDLEAGSLRLKGSGGSGGHRGMADIIARLGSSDLPRLRLGIGRPPEFLDPAAYVLQEIGAGEATILQEACTRGAAAVELWLTDGLIDAMDRYNRKQ